MWFWTNIVGLMCFSSLIGVVGGHYITAEKINWIEWIIPLYLNGLFIWMCIKNIKEERRTIVVTVHCQSEE